MSSKWRVAYRSVVVKNKVPLLPEAVALLLAVSMVA